MTVCVNAATGPQNQWEMVNGGIAPNPSTFKRGLEHEPSAFSYRLQSGRFGVSATNISVGTETMTFAPVNAVALRAKHDAWVKNTRNGRLGKREDDVFWEEADWEVVHDTIVEVLA